MTWRFLLGSLGEAWLFMFISMLLAEIVELEKILDQLQFPAEKGN